MNQKLYLIILLEPIPILGNYALLFYKYYNHKNDILLCKCFIATGIETLQ